MISRIRVRQIIPSLDKSKNKAQAYRLVKTLVGSLEVKKNTITPQEQDIHISADCRIKKLMRILSEKFPAVNIEKAIIEVKASMKPVEKPIGSVSKMLTDLKNQLKFISDFFTNFHKSSAKASHHPQYSDFHKLQSP